MKKEVTFVGPVSPPLSGPGVKNRTLVDAFRKEGVSVEVVNTLFRKVAAWKFLRSLLPGATGQRQFVLSVSTYGRYTLVPLLSVHQAALGNAFVLFVAGGALGKELKRCPGALRGAYVAALKTCDYVYVETDALREELSSFGIESARCLPNPRRPSVHRWRGAEEKGKARFAFISTLKPSKGVFEILDACEKLSHEEGNVQVDFYGPIRESRAQIMRRIEALGNAAYRGVLEPDAVTETMSAYDALVLPSYYEGEGLPGAIVEASLVGLPSITSTFPGSKQYFADQESALFVEQKNSASLASAMRKIRDDPSLARRLSESVSEVAKQFEIRHVMDRIKRDLLEKGWRL